MAKDKTLEEEGPKEESPPVEKETAAKKVACPSSPTGDHDIFHNVGTDERYCRYCGKTD